MEAQASRKRQFSGDDGGDGSGDELNKQPPQKRVRFPKGKKVKRGDEEAKENVPQDTEDELKDSQRVAEARSRRRNQKNAELMNEENGDLLDVVAASEKHYEDNESLVDDGIQLEPFNLEQERKEGYFDKSGNYVEYVTNEIKDAWLDSIEVDRSLAQRHSVVTDDTVETADLSSQEIGTIKRRIADALEPGETVLQALRRLKGSSSNRKEKMSAETKLVFDQLTEDAMKLMEDGDYNVYDEKQEVFQREAEGFEKLVRARGEGTSSNSGMEQPDSAVTKDSFLNGTHAADASLTNADSLMEQPDSAVTNDSFLNGTHAADTSLTNADDSFDIFAEDDENATPNPSSGDGALQNDYVFDDSSGYYYSSSLGYYYDPSSGLYCNAASGQWYTYNQESGTYDELPPAQANTT